MAVIVEPLFSDSWGLFFYGSVWPVLALSALGYRSVGAFTAPPSFAATAVQTSSRPAFLIPSLFPLRSDHVVAATAQLLPMMMSSTNDEDPFLQVQA